MWQYGAIVRGNNASFELEAQCKMLNHGVYTTLLFSLIHTLYAKICFSVQQQSNYWSTLRMNTEKYNHRKIFFHSLCICNTVVQLLFDHHILHHVHLKKHNQQTDDLIFACRALYFFLKMKRIHAPISNDKCIRALSIYQVSPMFDSTTVLSKDLFLLISLFVFFFSNQLDCSSGSAGSHDASSQKIRSNCL